MSSFKSKKEFLKLVQIHWVTKKEFHEPPEIRQKSSCLDNFWCKQILNLNTYLLLIEDIFLKNLFISLQDCFYSLISMRTIYHFNTWAIIWHGIVHWFMFFPRFYQFLLLSSKNVLHWHENQNKNNLLIILRKSWEIVRNQLTISCQTVANISKL